MSTAQNNDERLTSLEMLITHLQHDLEQLDEAVVGYRKDLESLRKDLERLQGHVERLELGPEARDPKLERPPHY
jgi:SlyX protein